VPELVVVLSDLFVSAETPEREWPPGVALPGLQQITRWGSRERTRGGWRPWLSHWAIGREAGSAGTVAATTLTPADTPALPRVWMATPVHLVAGLTTLHLDRRSVLRLEAAEAMRLRDEFRRVFHDSGFELRSLDSGDFLLFGTPVAEGGPPEPARALGANMAEAQRAGAADPALRRLGAEMEMWLHDHPVNVERQRRGEWPVTGLWLWGGGPVLASAPLRSSSSDIAFGNDAYLRGLLTLSGGKVLPIPGQPDLLFSYPHARGVVLLIEIASMLHSNRTWTLLDVVTQIDRFWITPAVEALQRGQLQRLVILANDQQLILRTRDRLKFWRRARPGLSGLQ
jgi:hypothetical protein